MQAQRPVKNAPMRLLACVCALILVVGALPMYAISAFNHPYYDDFNFSARVHDVWTETHSVAQVLAAAWDSAKTVRAEWQGTYTGTFLSNLQPGVFSENAYWLTTWLLLTVYLLCFGFLIATVLRKVLHAGASETVCAVCLLLFLLTQCLPEADEAFFWFNGGIGNTFIYSLLALSFALCIRLPLLKSAAAKVLTMLALLALMVLLGGGSYIGGLFGLCAYALICVYAFRKKSACAWFYAALTAVFLACFLYNVSAPGNAVRAAMLGTSVSPVKAVLQALYYGVALIGNSVRLPLLGVALFLAPMLYRLCKASPFRFAHPLWALAVGICLYCAQLTPTLYSGIGLGAGRITDTYYMSFVMLFLLYEGYVLGFVARRLEAKNQALCLSDALRRGLIVASACVFAVGCLGWKHADDTLYGPMNLAGGSALMSIVKGEAAQYDREMTAREALLNDGAQSTVTVAPLTVVPEIFMNDLLVENATYDVRPTLCRYYHKDAILIEGSDAP